jgi:hypothetical protein
MRVNPRSNPDVETDPLGLWRVVLLRVDRSSTEGCWLWTGHVTADGYGSIRSQGKSVYVHRVAVLARDGAIPDGMTVDHTCHNDDTACDLGVACPHRRCVNPAHLDVVTAQENTSRSPNKKPLALGKRCRHGHLLLTEADIYVRPSRGDVVCRRCRAIERQTSRLKQAS